MFSTVLSATVLSILPQVMSLSVPGRVAAAWYAGWHATATPGFPLSNISWNNYNTLIYSFAATIPSVNSLSLEGSDPSLLPTFVSQAHAKGVAAHIAIGGWGGSQWFSSNVATPENRTAFVQTVVNFANQYGLDGINFDWEYPNNQGIGCNVVDAGDTQNFLLFLETLRQAVGSRLTLSAATSVTPFRDSSGNPSTDVSAFAQVLDYITIMNYDIWGSWSSAVGPNAPLNDACVSSAAQQQGSAVSAVKAWTAAKMPAEQIVLGVPSYGHSYSVSPSDAFTDSSESELAAYPPFAKSNQPLGDAWDNTGGANQCGVYQGPGGTFELWGLIDGGFLNTDGSVAKGISYRFDSCSQTPYVYNKTSEVMVSFDNAQSFAAKGNYIQRASLKGFAMWEAGGDYQNILINSIRSAAGF